MSRNPSVTMVPTVAPRRSIRALVASVVPWTTAPMSGGASSARTSANRTPSSTPRTGSPGVVSTLLVRHEPPRSTATSVNVPPMSTASRGRVISIASSADCGDHRTAGSKSHRHSDGNPYRAARAETGIGYVPRLFEGLPPRFEGGRYHSLYADRGSFPVALAITAESDEGIVMAVEHPELPVAAVQFHPESILTLDDDAGLAVVMNVMRGLGRSGLGNGQAGSLGEFPAKSDSSGNSETGSR